MGRAHPSAHRILLSGTKPTQIMAPYEYFYLYETVGPDGTAIFY